MLEQVQAGCLFAVISLDISSVGTIVTGGCVGENLSGLYGTMLGASFTGRVIDLSLVQGSFTLVRKSVTLIGCLALTSVSVALFVRWIAIVLI